MSQATQPNPLQYPSFNAFFTRALRPGARPIDIDPGVFISPVDGTISQIGRLEGSRLLQAKGHDYTLEALLGGPNGWTERFAGGAFATLYLAPYNYHRIHMPLAGTLKAAWYVPGRLFSVNAVTAGAVPGLFARNERVVCVFEQGARKVGPDGARVVGPDGLRTVGPDGPRTVGPDGPRTVGPDGPPEFAMVLVGALFVGSISTVWHGDVTPRSPRSKVDLPVEGSRAPLRLNKGVEMGRFNMGSTVIVLLPPDTLEWLPRFSAGTRIEVGRMLARLQ